MANGPPRARTARRQKERDLRKTVRELERLAAVAEGGSPDRAILVASTSVVETRARAVPCIQCKGELELREHTAEFHVAEQMRRVQLVCRTCHAQRQLWFRLGRVLPS